jgi:hypothetical protein
MHRHVIFLLSHLFLLIFLFFFSLIPPIETLLSSFPFSLPTHLPLLSHNLHMLLSLSSCHVHWAFFITGARDQNLICWVLEGAKNIEEKRREFVSVFVFLHIYIVFFFLLHVILVLLSSLFFPLNLCISEMRPYSFSCLQLPP